MKIKSPKYLIGLDRDGTINQDPGYLGRSEDWKEEPILFCPQALEGLRLLRSQPDFRVIVASNQAGVARGYFSASTMYEVNDHIRYLLKSQGIELDAFLCCSFIDEEYAEKIKMAQGSPFRRLIREKGINSFRKPGIGMLKSGASYTGLTLNDFSGIYFVGDKSTDVQTGLNAGGLGVLVNDGSNTQELTLTQELSKIPEYQGRIFVASDLLNAAQRIIEDTKTRGRY